MEEHDFYPQKPDLVEKKTEKNVKKTIFSIILFILTFMLIGGVQEFSFILFLVLVIFIHEMGHFSFMKLFKYTNVKMMFIPLMGAFVSGKKEEYNQKESLVVILAGPIPGIILGMFFLYYGIEWKISWMSDISFLFLFLNVLNLLPLDPLDGGQALKLLGTKNQDRFQLVFSFISSLIMIGVGWYLEFWIVVVFGFIMGLRVRSIQKNLYIHKELTNRGVDYIKNYKSLTNREFSIIKEVVVENTPALRTYMDNIDDETVDPIIASQVNNALVTPINRNASFLFKVATVLIWIACFILPFLLFVYLKLLSK